MKSPAFQGLLHFLELSESRLYIPEVVVKEVKKGFKRQLGKHHAQLQNLIKEYDNLAKPGDSPNIIYENFETTLNRKLANHKDIEVLVTPQIDLNNLIDRSLAEKPPFGAHSRGFRDAVIWETMKNSILGDSRGAVIITNNTDDFGENNLKPELLEELGKKSKDLLYFKDIGSFLSAKGEQLEFITFELVSSWLEKEVELFKTAVSDISSLDYEDIFDIDDLDRSSDIENYNFDVPEYEEFELESFYVYKEDEKYIYIEVELWLQLAVYVDYYYGSAYDYSPIEDDFTYAANEEDSDYLNGHIPYTVQYRVNKKTKEHQFWAE